MTASHLARRMVLAVATASVLAACTSKKSERSPETAAAAKPGAMPAMPGMSGMMSSAMMDSMSAEMRSMSSMSAAEMARMLPQHRQMVANMLSQMTSDMRSMNMPGDAAWTATVDSVRQDLVRFPDMTPAELKGAMPAHQARVSRLMTMHREMMSKP